MKKVLLISNMYPSKKFPFFGTFVKNSEDVLTENDIAVDKVVIDKKCNNIISKVFIYLKFYIFILCKLFFGKYNYIYAHYVSHVSLPLLIYTLFNKKVKIVVHVHGGDIKKLDGTSSIFFKVKYFFANLILKKANKIIVPSKAYKFFLNNEFDFTNYKDVIIYPSGGIDCNIFYLNKSTKVMEYKLGFAGRLVRSKNVHLILEALSNTKNFTLEIVGNGPEYSNLVTLAEKLNIQDRVLFFDSKSQLELAEWYREIDYLIYPSESESLGLVPIEAIACGVSVILSKIPAFCELQLNGFHVNLIDSISANDIYVTLSYIKDDNNQQRKHNAFLAKELYSRNKVQGDLLNVFQ
ncbi:glycosyltransferase family 4 protein [Photobacterium iliopiscarium]|uniref:glycosyltransferase family 4 protein n=1 Tax=Photobacterium iliopiscarium TaxID=56192 RepID=UPI00242E250E|nr:glycosyltransferase family 4 protein [Photobacterium iliopiscarium]